jgi:hypothetical protein
VRPRPQSQASTSPIAIVVESLVVTPQSSSHSQGRASKLVQTKAIVGAGVSGHIKLASSDVQVFGVVVQGLGQVVLGTDGVLIYTAPAGFLGIDRLSLWTCTDAKACAVQEVEVAVRPPSRLVLGAGTVSPTDAAFGIEPTIRASRSLAASAARLVVIPLLSLGASVLGHGLLGGTRFAGLVGVARHLTTRTL